MLTRVRFESNQPVLTFATAGGVFIYRGTDLGLTPWMRITPPQPADGMQFGFALDHVPDADGGFGKLVVGAPGSEVSGQPAAGVLYPFAIGPKELTVERRLVKDMFAYAGPPEAHDRFGHALAVGRFRTGAELDLAIRAPGARFAGDPGSGCR